MITCCVVSRVGGKTEGSTLPSDHCCHSRPRAAIGREVYHWSPGWSVHYTEFVEGDSRGTGQQ